MPKIPGKKFENLEKIYGVDKAPPVRKLEARKSDAPLKPFRPPSSRPGGGDREVRRLKLDRAKELLSGKVSTVWIYAISSKIDDGLKDRIFDVYKGLLDDENIVPYVKEAW